LFQNIYDLTGNEDGDKPRTGVVLAAN